MATQGQAGDSASAQRQGHPAAGRGGVAWCRAVRGWSATSAVAARPMASDRGRTRQPAASAPRGGHGVQWHDVGPRGGGGSAAAARGEVREQTWTTRAPPRSSGLVPPRAPAPVRTHKPDTRSHRPPRPPAPRGARAYPCLPRACSCVLREAKPGHACSRSRRRRLLFCLLLLASAVPPPAACDLGTGR